MANEVALVLPFSLNPLTGSIITTNNQDQIWEDRVRMAVQTGLGERVMRPAYGTKIPSALFDTITGFETTLTNELNKIFVEQLPLLELVTIEPNHSVKDNRLSVSITYKLPNNNETTTKIGVMVVSDTNPPYEELA